MERARKGEGGGFTKRADDNPEALKVRLHEYHEKTRPLLDLYEARGLLITVEANRAIETVAEDIRTCLGLPAKPQSP